MKTDTSNHETTIQAALTAHQSGDLEAAKTLYETILNASPNHTEALHGLAILLGQQGHAQDALRHAQQLVSIDERPEYFNTLGNIHKRMQHDQEAQSCYEKALALNPKYYVAHNSLGCLCMPGDYQAAKQHFQSALSLAPQYPDALYNAALCAIQLDQLNEARQYLMRCLAQTPHHPAALFQLSQVLYLQGADKKALHAIRRAIAHDHESIDHYFHEGTILTRMNQVEEAIASFEKCIVIDPNHIESHHNVAALYTRLQQPLRALPHYLFMAQKAPTPQLYHDLAVVYMQQERHQDAIQYFHEALRLDPNHLSTHINLGAIMIKCQQKDKAIAHYQSAKALDPENPEYDFLIDGLSKHPQHRSPPKEYITHLFDAYADHYDQHLSQVLKYQVHEAIHQALHETDGDKAHYQSLLDLGCGSGLCGAQLRTLCDQMVGVDLSTKMLEVAKSKSIYNELHEASIIDFLGRKSPFDCIVAADVMPYLGELDDCFAHVVDCMTPDTRFVFTTEISHGKNFALQDSLRYAHHETYIQSLANAHGLTILSQKRIVARQQNNQAVHCYLWVCSKA